MWRSLFLAAGIILCILGAECLVLEKAVMAQEAANLDAPSTLFTQPVLVSSSREIKPPDWAPWSLLSTGAVVILYSYTLPKRNKAG